MQDKFAPVRAALKAIGATVVLRSEVRTCADARYPDLKLYEINGEVAVISRPVSGDLWVRRPGKEPARTAADAILRAANGQGLAVLPEYEPKHELLHCLKIRADWFLFVVHLLDRDDFAILEQTPGNPIEFIEATKTSAEIEGAMIGHFTALRRQARRDDAEGQFNG